MVSRTMLVVACLGLSGPLLADQPDPKTVLGLAPGTPIGALKDRLDLAWGDRPDALVSRRLPESLPNVVSYELVFEEAGLAAIKGFTGRREPRATSLAEDFAALRAWLETRYGPPDVAKGGVLPLAGWNEGLPDVLDRVGLMVRPDDDGYVVLASFLFAGFDVARRPPKEVPIDPDGYTQPRVGGAGYHHIPWGADRETLYADVHRAGSPTCAPIGEQAVTCSSVSIDGALEAQVSAYFDPAGRLVHLEELYSGSERYAEFEWASQYLGFEKRYTPGFPVKDDAEDGWVWEGHGTRMLMRRSSCRDEGDERRCGFELDYRPLSGDRTEAP